MIKGLRLALAAALTLGTLHGQSVEKAAEEAPRPPSKADAKKAEGAFRRALRLQSQPENTDNLDHALEALEESRTLDPSEPTYATTYEFVKQQLIASHLEKGDKLMQLGLTVEALAEYREVLQLDAHNQMAQERVRAATGGDRRPQVAIVSDFASEPVVKPKPGKLPFEFRGDSRQLISSVGKLFGVVVLFDDTAPARTVRFKIDAADFATMMRAANQVAGTFWMPMSETQVVVAADNADSRRRLERMSVRTYQLNNLQTAQELTDIVNLLRSMLDIRFVIADQAAQTMTVRAPGDILHAVDSLVEDLSVGRPEVVLEIHAFHLDRSMSRNIGVELPLQFTLFNVATEARNLLSQSGSNQALIDQLIATGGISASDAAAIAAALAAQGSNSPFLQPFAVFGGGKTLTGLVIPNVGLRLDYSKTTVSTIQHMTLRASEGNAATYRIGDRIPVLTSQYAPLISIPGRNNSNLTNGLIPSFNYEDLGITLKTTPRVSNSNDVTLQIDLQIKALSGQQFNSVPAISERIYTGSVTVKDGQPSVLAGSINVQESNSVRGLPWFSRIPLIGLAGSTRSKQDVQSELLFIITPHVLRAPRNPRERTEMVLGQ